MFMRRHRPKLVLRRRGAVLFLACSLVEASCYNWVDFYSDCPADTAKEETESVPPCPEAGVDDAGPDAADSDAGDADAANPDAGGGGATSG